MTLDCHFEFYKSDSRFLISDPKSPYTLIFPEKLEFSQHFVCRIGSAILNFPNLKVGS